MIEVEPRNDLACPNCKARAIVDLMRDDDSYKPRAYCHKCEARFDHAGKDLVPGEATEEDLKVVRAFVRFGR